jgi:hypothetical protein
MLSAYERPLCARSGPSIGSTESKRPDTRSRRAKFSKDTHVLLGAPDQVLAEYTAHTASALTATALGSSCGEEACGLFGELLKKLKVRAVPGIRVEDQPGIR